MSIRTKGNLISPQAALGYTDMMQKLLNYVQSHLAKYPPNSCMTKSHEYDILCIVQYGVSVYGVAHLSNCDEQSLLTTNLSSLLLEAFYSANNLLYLQAVAKLRY